MPRSRAATRPAAPIRRCQIRLLGISGIIQPDSVTHPSTFAPEFINAFELGTKNTLLDGALTFNGECSITITRVTRSPQIVDRTSINLNFDAKVQRRRNRNRPMSRCPACRFNFSGGWEDTSLAEGSKAIDLMDRTAGHTDWVVAKPSVFSTSNCILPQYVAAELVEAALINPQGFGDYWQGGQYISSVGWGNACETAYNTHQDPIIGEGLTGFRAAIWLRSRPLRRTMAKASTRICPATSCPMRRH